MFMAAPYWLILDMLTTNLWAEFVSFYFGVYDFTVFLHLSVATKKFQLSQVKLYGDVYPEEDNFMIFILYMKLYYSRTA